LHEFGHFANHMTIKPPNQKAKEKYATMMSNRKGEAGGMRLMGNNHKPNMWESAKCCLVKV
jgi:hypothetical protein